MNHKRLHIEKSNTDYSPFGHCFSYETDNFDYRNGFNGQEGDDEISGINWIMLSYIECRK